MKIYVDLVLFLNFLFDFLLLLTVATLLKRNVSLSRLMWGAFFGSLTILALFIEVNSISLFFLKVVFSILMILISFGYKGHRYFFKNLGFFYMSSMVLGGFLYFLNVEFSYQQVGLVFYHKELSINFLFLLFSSPLILYFYKKQASSLKHQYSFYYKVKIKWQEKNILLNAYLDTGNKLIDPISKSPIILINEKKLTREDLPCIYVPFHTVNGEGILKCIRIPTLEIEGVGKKENVLVGLMQEEIRMDGIDCILNTKLLEG